jgi:hypothetical protein
MVGAGATARRLNRLDRISERELRRRMRSALILLDWAFQRHGPEKVAPWLLANPDIAPGCRKQFEAVSHIHCMESFFGDLHELMRKGITEHEPKCAVCGKPVIGSISRALAQLGVEKICSPRSDTRYCSARCRQKAYRKRVTAGRIDRRRSRNEQPSPLQISAPIIQTDVTGAVP